MSKLAQRFFIFFFGVPAVAALVLLLPHRNHLALSLTVVAFSAMGALEFSIMLAQKNLRIPKPEAVILGALLPVAALLAIAFGLESGALAILVAMMGAMAWLLLSRVFHGGETLANFVNSVAAGFSTLLYPGLFMVGLVSMTRWGGSTSVIITTFLLMVFGGDSLAWATGMMFGKGNRGVVPASPNKSVAGFAGGILGPIIVGIGASLIFPRIFVPSFGVFADMPFVAGIILGLFTGCAAILGDLAESAFKRSSGIKDSGSFIIGRGGVLDSIDSIAMAAPVFYICFTLLFA
ncbi:MAG: phosphatidate cytidylyltransferase [Treponema sp.]|nr:phosphatidate cytidylyltransferase [Treponema sp.]